MISASFWDGFGREDGAVGGERVCVVRGWAGDGGMGFGRL